MLRKGDEPVPGYRLEEFLGRGQFGEVWRAMSPGRAGVALKFLNLSERQGWKEFRAIQQVKAIRHPHLAAITALWLLDEDGRLLGDDVVDSYANASSAMRNTLVAQSTMTGKAPARLVVATSLCDKSLLDRLEECRKQGLVGIPVEDLLRYMEEAAKGIDFLNSPQHDLGEGPVSVQHCDIKPANLMLLGDSATVCDFGVARVLADAHAAATGTSMAGSPAYMAPESFDRRTSTTADQYALAITYCELRTGHLPFRSESWNEVFEAHRTGKLELSRLTEPEQEVIRKATAHNPSDRYRSCVVMVRALRRAVEGESSEPARRTWVWPVAAGLLMLVGTVLVLLRDRIWPNPTPVPTVLEIVAVQLEVSPPDALVTVDGAPQALVQGELRLEREKAGKLALRVEKPPEFVAVDQELDLAAFDGRPIVISLARDANYSAEAFARRAREALLAPELSAEQWNQAVADYKRAIELDEAKYAVAPLVHSKLLAGDRSYSQGTIAVSEDSRWLAGRARDTDVLLWDLGDLREAGTLHTQESQVSYVSLANRCVASEDSENRTAVTRFGSDGKAEVTANLEVFHAEEAVLSPDGRWLVGSDSTRTVEGMHSVKVWDVKAWNASSDGLVLGAHAELIYKILFTPDSRWAITASADDTIGRWDLMQPGQGGTIATAVGDVVAMAVSPNGLWLAYAADAKVSTSSGEGYVVTLVELATGQARVLAEGHSGAIEMLAFDASSMQLAAASAGWQLQVWQLDTLVPTRALAATESVGRARGLAFAPLDRWIAIADDSGDVRLYPTGAGPATTVPLVLRGESGPILRLHVTPRWIIAETRTGAIVLWDLRTAILVKRACDELGKTPSETTGGGKATPS
jgi:serine/threonine protein kinase/WD40 repeat protein